MLAAYVMGQEAAFALCGCHAPIQKRRIRSVKVSLVFAA